MLINTNGLAFFGPGSEWFWSMAQFVVVVVTLLGIYRQLTIAAGANAFEQMSKLSEEWASERMSRNILEILLAIQAGKDAQDVPEGAASYVGDFWENVGALVRAGHIDKNLVYDFLGGSCRSWWATLGPFVRHWRVAFGTPQGGEHFEWLAGVMAEIDSKTGTKLRVDDAYLRSTLDRRIQNDRDRIRIAEELRAVIVRPAFPTPALVPDQPESPPE